MVVILLARSNSAWSEYPIKYKGEQVFALWLIDKTVRQGFVNPSAWSLATAPQP